MAYCIGSRHPFASAAALLPRARLARHGLGQRVRSRQRRKGGRPASACPRAASFAELGL